MVEAVPRKGFVIPGWLAWVMVFAGIIVFLIGIPFFIYSLIIWGYFRVFDAKGIAMMIVGAIIFYVGYKNTGFILTREEIIDRWSVLIENGKVTPLQTTLLSLPQTGIPIHCLFTILRSIQIP